MSSGNFASRPTTYSIKQVETKESIKEMGKHARTIHEYIKDFSEIPCLMSETKVDLLSRLEMTDYEIDVMIKRIHELLKVSISMFNSLVEAYAKIDSKLKEYIDQAEGGQNGG